MRKIVAPIVAIVFILGLAYILIPDREEPVPEIVNPPEENYFSEQVFPYFGDALALAELPREEMVAILLGQYPKFDPIDQYETSDEAEQEAFLQHFGGHVSREQMDQVLYHLYTMNNLLSEETFLPETPTLVPTGLEPCTPILFNALGQWPESFKESDQPFYHFEEPPLDDFLGTSYVTLSAFKLYWGDEKRMRTTCTEHFEGPGGTYHSASIEITLFYNEEGELVEALALDPEVDMNDSPIFEVNTVNPRARWGAAIIANQMAFPNILYYYESL